jgi:hypothetical protein
MGVICKRARAAMKYIERRESELGFRIAFVDTSNGDTYYFRCKNGHSFKPRCGHVIAYGRKTKCIECLRSQRIKANRKWQTKPIWKEINKNNGKKHVDNISDTYINSQLIRGRAVLSKAELDIIRLTIKIKRNIGDLNARD